MTVFREWIATLLTLAACLAGPCTAVLLLGWAESALISLALAGVVYWMAGQMTESNNAGAGYAAALSAFVGWLVIFVSWLLGILVLILT